VVLGNNTARLVIFQNCPKYHKPRSSKWYLENFEILRAGITAKYYVQVMLLFVYNRSRKIFSNAQETFFFRVEKKKNTGIYACDNLFTLMEEMIDSFLQNQYKPLKANNMKQFNESNL